MWRAGDGEVKPIKCWAWARGSRISGRVESGVANHTWPNVNESQWLHGGPADGALDDAPCMSLKGSRPWCPWSGWAVPPRRWS